MKRRASLPAVAVLALAGLFAALGPAAPASAAGCPRQAGPEAPAGEQLRAMLCFVNGARDAHGLDPLAGSAVLDRAAGRKSADILRCDSFSHEACGRPFTYWMDRFDYLNGCGAAGENIAWGNGTYAAARSIFRNWMHSPGHRANILGEYEEIGIGLRIGSLEGNPGAHVWTQDFGSPC